MELILQCVTAGMSLHKRAKWSKYSRMEQMEDPNLRSKTFFFLKRRPTSLRLRWEQDIQVHTGKHLRVIQQTPHKPTWYCSRPMSGEDKWPHFYKLTFHSLRWGQWGGNTPVLAEKLEALISVSRWWVEKRGWWTGNRMLGASEMRWALSDSAPRWCLWWWQPQSWCLPVEP